jgi:hypothetical protein
MLIVDLGFKNRTARSTTEPHQLSSTCPVHADFLTSPLAKDESCLYPCHGSAPFVRIDKPISLPYCVTIHPARYRRPIQTTDVTPPLESTPCPPPSSP